MSRFNIVLRVLGCFEHAALDKLECMQSLSFLVHIN